MMRKHENAGPAGKWQEVRGTGIQRKNQVIEKRKAVNLAKYCMLWSH